MRMRKGAYATVYEIVQLYARTFARYDAMTAYAEGGLFYRAIGTSGTMCCKEEEMVYVV